MTFLKMSDPLPMYSADLGGALGSNESKEEEKDEVLEADLNPLEPEKTPEKTIEKTDEEPEKTVEELAKEMAKQMVEDERNQLSEAKRLAGLSDEDKKLEELSRKAELYDQVLKEKADLEEEKRKLELREATAKLVKESELPEQVTGLPLGETAEDIHKNIKLLATIFSDYKKSLKPEVKGRTPDVITEKLSGLTQEQFMKMKISERSKLEQSNKPLYDEMINKFYTQNKKR